MPIQAKASLVNFLYQIGAIQFGKFQLKNGQTSSIYINLRKIISYPQFLRAIAKAMHEMVHTVNYDLVCGVPYTALPIATCFSLDYEIPMVMRRREKKDYGTRQMIEGEFNPGQSCLIVEDVITTGSSIIETAQELKNAGLEIRDAVALIDREQGGRRTLEQHFCVHTVFTLSEILQSLLDSTLLKSAEHQIIEQFLAEKST